MAPVLERLRGASECTLIPTGALALLPLHAAWTKAAGRRTYTLDVVAVSYAVSLRALAAARAPAKDTQRMLAIEDPQPVKADPLPAAAREVAAVTGHFASVNRLAGPAATLTAVMEGLADSDCIYFACHGAVDETNPVDSYVLLADDERLTLGAITRGGRLGAGLVVFSACESAIAGMTAIDEVLNLPSALLERGAGAAIGSLWIANDGATALLMARIFWNWREGGMDLPAAMRDAQQWVRDATNGQMVEWLTSTAPTNEGHRRLSLRRAGLPPDERPFPHVADWGAFVYFGR
jgi:CHAT domain-containing protein